MEICSSMHHTAQHLIITILLIRYDENIIFSMCHTLSGRPANCWKLISLINIIKKAIDIDTGAICSTNHFALLLSLTSDTLSPILASFLPFFLSTLLPCVPPSAYPLPSYPSCFLATLFYSAYLHLFATSLCRFQFCLITASSRLLLQLASDKTKFWKTRCKILNSSRVSPLELAPRVSGST